MSIGTKEAADLVGMSKPGIIKAIRQGKLSAQKDAKGEWKIEPVELFRVYPAIAKQNGSEHPQNTPSSQENTLDETASLRLELRHTQERLADKEDVIRDLRERLDVEADERRKLTLILTDTLNTKNTPPLPEESKRQSWWHRLLGNG